MIRHMTSGKLALIFATVWLASSAAGLAQVEKAELRIDGMT